jgi:hypothetical protein
LRNIYVQLPVSFDNNQKIKYKLLDVLKYGIEGIVNPGGFIEVPQNGTITFFRINEYD